MDYLIDQKTPNELVDPQAQKIVTFLENIGLPSENIIAEQDQRNIIGKMLPDFLNDLPAEVKRDARYLSKFVVGAGYGLFDYSLNAIWNEVVLSLRKKAISYGLEIFFDAAVSGKARELYKTEADLPSLKDAVLLDTCKKLELIKEVTHKKLRFILDMRNDVGISHPTDYHIGAFDLLSWLTTCVKDVLNDQPTDAAIKVQAFIANLRNNFSPLDAAGVLRFENKLKELPTHHTENILRTIFGIYVSQTTDLQVRKNISLLAPSVWNSCKDDIKYQLGIILEGYHVNFDNDKKTLGDEFFTVVDGNRFKTENERILILDSWVEDLVAVHNDFNNFHTEPSRARVIASYIRDQRDIPSTYSEKLTKTILSCRLGNGYGVSTGALPYYDQLLSKLGDQYCPQALAVLSHYEFQRKLDNNDCRRQAVGALQKIREGVIQPRLLECLDYLIANIEQNKSCAYSHEFKILTSGYVTWN